MNQKMRLMLVALCLTMGVHWGYPVSGGASWLDKGKSVLKSLGSGETESGSSALSVEEIGAGLKEALRVGSGNVVEQLGAEDGFNLDPDIHIPVPPTLARVRTMLEKVGMSSLFDTLELKLNRAAEAAAPKAANLFLDAISQMTMGDVKQIYDGPDDAATQYFKEKMSAGLAQEMEPVVEETMLEVGAVKAYDTMMAKYKSLPMVPDVKADLTSYVVEKGMDAIFYYMAKEEAAIRNEPVKRTTELLKKVFGQ